MKKWIGLFHVIPIEDNALLSKKAIGAYVNVIALAENEKDFIRTAFKNFKSLNFKIEDYQDIELFELRILKSSVSEEIMNLAETLTPKNQLVFDTFNSYAEDD